MLHFPNPALNSVCAQVLNSGKVSVLMHLKKRSKLIFKNRYAPCCCNLMGRLLEATARFEFSLCQVAKKRTINL